MKNSKILIVDDNAKNIQVLASTLNELYDIEYTTDGYDAIKWVKAESFDLILLDVMMPNINGFQVCEIIRKDKTLNDIPIVFLTAKTHTDSIVKGFKAGGQDYITKPFNDEELKARINTHLELKKSKEKLSDLNKWLENEVAQRTKDLQLAYKELEVLDIAKDDFLHLVSHELRTPLNGIIGFTEIIKSLIDSDELMEYLSILEMSSDRLLRFTESATLSTSLRINTYKFKPEKLNPFSVLEKAGACFKKRCAKSGITLKISEPVDDMYLWGDAELIIEACKRLIDNAINYSPDHATVEVSVLGDEKYVDIFIDDQGPGFSKKALDKLFVPFELGERHIEQNIGLSIHLVKLIMEAHRSTIKVLNLDERGARVHLRFLKDHFKMQ